MLPLYVIFLLEKTTEHASVKKLGQGDRNKIEVRISDGTNDDHQGRGLRARSDSRVGSRAPHARRHASCAAHGGRGKRLLPLCSTHGSVSTAR